VNAKCLDSKIVGHIEMLGPIICESLQKNDIAVTLLNELIDFKRQHTLFFSDFCDSTIFGECATDSFDGTFSNSDPAPTIDIMFHILKGLE
jgi:hypothetical protein